MVARLAKQELIGLRTADTGVGSVEPILKWAGGKRSILEHLLRYVPARLSNYYEPFLGGAALFLGICNGTTSFKAFLSDLNEDLINVYTVVKDSPEDLIESLSTLHRGYYGASDREAYYYERRAWRPRSRVESAARLIFLNKTCYNGLYRVNSKGEFNVPFGDYERPKILNEPGIRSMSEAFRKTDSRLRCLDYRRAVGNCEKGDFVYFDPPYNPTSETASFTSYTATGFSKENQEQLAEVFSDLGKRGCKVVLSNSDTPLVRDLYQEFVVKRVDVSRAINSVGTRRTGFHELIISSWDPAKPL